MIIPGHFRAITWLVILVLSGVTYWLTREPQSVFGIAVLIIGMFVVDQSTHLQQENHRDMPETHIEGWLQRYYKTSVVMGLIISVAGILLVFNPLI